MVMGRTLPDRREQPIADEADHVVVTVVQVLEEDARHAERAKLLDALGDLLHGAGEPAVAALREELLGLRVTAADREERAYSMKRRRPRSAV